MELQTPRPFEKMGRSEGVNKLPGHMGPSLDSSPGSRDAVKAEKTFDCVAMKQSFKTVSCTKSADLSDQEAQKLRLAFVA